MTLVRKFIKIADTAIYWSEDLSFIFSLFPENSFCDIAWSISFTNTQMDSISFLNKVHWLRVNFLVKRGKKCGLLLHSIKQFLSAGLNVLPSGHCSRRHTWNTGWQGHQNHLSNLQDRSLISAWFSLKHMSKLYLCLYCRWQDFYALNILLSPCVSSKQKNYGTSSSDHVLWKYSHSSKKNSQTLKVGAFSSSYCL